MGSYSCRKCISMVIARTASKNVAFKVATMRDSIIIMVGQHEFMMRKTDSEGLGPEDDNKELLRT